MGFSNTGFAQAILTKIGSPFSMFNGADLSAWTQTGNISWQINGDELVATQGSGMLVSKLSAPDYLIEFDYWVSDNTQASIYFRCTNPSVINAETAYEVPLVNQTNGQAAGSMRLLSRIKPTLVANRWNHMQISAIGTQISITLNGVTNQVTDTHFDAGPIAVSYQRGGFRLRNINVTIPTRW